MVTHIYEYDVMLRLGQGLGNVHDTRADDADPFSYQIGYSLHV